MANPRCIHPSSSEAQLSTENLWIWRIHSRSAGLRSSWLPFFRASTRIAAIVTAIVGAAVAAAAEVVSMATTTMAMTCPASSLNAHSSSSSSFQAGCSTATQDLAWYAPRVANGSQKSLQRTVQVRAGKGPPKQGRGYNSKKAAAEGIKKIMRERDSDSTSDGWVQVLTEAEIPEGKNKAIIYNNAGYVLVKRDNALFAIQANCTSCKFPVIEGTVSVAEATADGTSQGEPQIECPLCHTKFSLEDGKVVEYCPKDGPIAWAIGSFKEKEAPVPAKVYSARISKSGRVYVRFGAPTPAIP